MTDELQDRLVLARTVAREAGEIALRLRSNPDALNIQAKGPQDWVTAADCAVERHIRQRLTTAFPADSMLGEEDGGEATAAMWVVDPIDGTTNFLRGLPEFAVSIAYVQGTTTELGVIYAPALDILYEARRGAGATRNGVAMRTRDTATIDTAVITLGFDAKDDTTAFLEHLSAIIRAGSAFRRFGAATIGLAAVAAGHVDAFWQLKLNAWDVLAGMLMVEEAGGRTNDFIGAGGLTQRTVTLATAPGVAEQYARLTDVTLK